MTAFLIVVVLAACAQTPSKVTAAPSPVPSTPVPEAKKAQQGRPTLSEPALYILSGEAFKVEQLTAVLDSLLKQNDGSDNLIFYVHGRGAGRIKEPKKSLKEVMPSLTHDYTSKSIMFYWPGSDEGGKTGFPEHRAREAAPALGQALTILQQYKHDNAAHLHNTKFTLLLHSMGNIVFETFMRSYQAQSFDPGLFDTIVLNSSATATKGHDEWLRKVDFSPYRYVTVNDDDRILLGVSARRGARLGKKLQTTVAGKAALAPNVIYLDFTNTGVNHRYFISSGQAKNPFLWQFYETVMNGKAFDFTEFTGIKKTERRDGATIYYFKRK